MSRSQLQRWTFFRFTDLDTQSVITIVSPVCTELSVAQFLLLEALNDSVQAGHVGKVLIDMRNKKISIAAASIQSSAVMCAGVTNQEKQGSKNLPNVC